VFRKLKRYMKSKFDKELDYDAFNEPPAEK